MSTSRHVLSRQVILAARGEAGPGIRAYTVGQKRWSVHNNFPGLLDPTWMTSLSFLIILIMIRKLGVTSKWLPYIHTISKWSFYPLFPDLELWVFRLTFYPSPNLYFSSFIPLNFGSKGKLYCGPWVLRWVCALVYCSSLTKVQSYWCLT